MDNTHAQNAMTEIALALAMGFFCIMILAMVSMGVSPEQAAPSKSAFEGAVLAPPQQDAKTTQAPDDTTILIFHDNRYFTPDLLPLDPGALARNKPVILAVAPGLSMAEALQAQSDLAVDSITLSTLSPEWQARLAHLSR
ncbi:hypothetical protein JCM17960_00150 [Magnetospira thiophila]